MSKGVSVHKAMAFAGTAVEMIFVRSAVNYPIKCKGMQRDAYLVAAAATALHHYVEFELRKSSSSSNL